MRILLGDIFFTDSTNNSKMGFEINNFKTEYMFIRSDAIFPVVMEEKKPIGQVKTNKFLGVTITNEECN